jgi:DNA modification methylase
MVAYEPKDLKNNKLHIGDRAVHDWYRFVLSYPPHLVRQYFDRFALDSKSVVFDPFCGTGTTLVEAKKNSIASYGVEVSPIGYLATKVKTNWGVDCKKLQEYAHVVVGNACNRDRSGDVIHTFTEEQNRIILKDSISPKPLNKCLLLSREIKAVQDSTIQEILMLALGYISVFTASNLKFGPEVGVRREKKDDASVFESFFEKVNTIAEDIRQFAELSHVQSNPIMSDSRYLNGYLPENAFDAVITSPPYPNEKDYTRTTRLESVILGLINSRAELRQFKQNFLRSNTRNVYVTDHEDMLIPSGSQVDRIASEIERRRIALKKTSGFEKLYQRVTRLYFGGMKQHLLELRRYLKPGAQLAYVVGDQASYLQVLIRTGELLAEIAHEIGYKVVDLDLFRTRISTTTGEQLREEVLILEWNSNKRVLPVKKNDEKKNRYNQLIEKVFFKHYKEGDRAVEFLREDFEPLAKELGIRLPKNLGDIIYSYRYRNDLPIKLQDLLQSGEEWVIRSVGRGKYQFAITAIHRISPNLRLSRIKILDATPEIIRRYALNDEQALLAILRYNRLIDIFLGITCYPLQSHLRTTVPGMGQVETDEIYIGINKKGTQFAVPVQAKGNTDELGIVQIEQDFEICRTKFPNLICRSVAAQFIDRDLIALFELERSNGEITIKEEKHYHIVPNDCLSDAEVNQYSQEQ